jgi:hypothetical protein
MKKVTIKNPLGIQTHGADMEDPTAWIAECVAANAWGKPERFVLHKDEPMAEVYDDVDVLEEKVEQDPLGVERKYVKLKAEYTIEIEDITEQHNLQQVIAKRKAEYPSAEEFMNAFFDGGDEALAALQAKRLEIKAKYPKN